ncbi:glutamine--fructose-6-phosphate transaminase (isomerizing) [Bittarella massiliensis (ex Durand et al. 2017)]|uniref:glutamine--fructose-6-phosphate transaminase (isomerizing) n=1 Tax=Bittarella massiliensis (ex Durand et al. 2017) TaxID=1720313 RepID=UPI001AA11211|nr:glutamine--fructose-6-phosphate transaminase (isomerizing) [Bittarella massiliensis (ex Durand et al. 2017)]MBO1679704.1 glutamine--fructose-6-phosphate transaminase (isomerizing) [Bittarella massiliensis (ex Durand et al. 2017)]
MCGIVGYVGRENCADLLIDGLSKLEYRGYDSAGVAIFDQGAIRVVKAQGRLACLEEKLKSQGWPTGHCGIGHTRWATHGVPSDVNSHPHCGKHTAVVHNGIIENYIEIKEFLLGKGYTFQSQTDTETVAKLLDYHLENGAKDEFDAISRTLRQVRGSYALGILFDSCPDKLFGVRKESPLIVGLGEGENFIASDVPAILKHTRNYYLLEENEVATLTAEGVTITDLDRNPIEKEVLTATWDIEAAEKGGYPHFMLKEIFEQPSAFSNTVSPRLRNGKIDLGIELSDEQLKAFKQIHIVACGTAMHAGIVGRYLIEKLARTPVNVDVASEFRYRDPILNKEDLVIIISQSGETADTLAAMRLAKKHGAHTLAVVNVVGSSIAREADSVLYTWAGPEIAVASTKAYTVQLSVMYLLAFKLGLCKGTLSQADADALIDELAGIPVQLQSILGHAEEYKAIAEKYCRAEDMFFIGRGLDYALSQEGSLKLKEISYIHSEAYAAGELKHGTISLITDGVPVIALATQQRLCEKMVSNIKEVKARGADVLFICYEGYGDCSEFADSVIALPQSNDLFAPLLSIIPMQLFAYYVALLKGCDVDKPRNLAKSVTVE